jgi:2-amino-4-hydroxy-6-hydroxymethyldihydropteridine diphosphokinase
MAHSTYNIWPISLLRSAYTHPEFSCTSIRKREPPSVLQVAHLSLGSNLGDRQSNLRAALARLASAGELASVSSLYETQPVELIDQPWFLNCAAALKTDLTGKELMSHLLRIEEDMGRRRLARKGPRIIDLDILLLGDTVIDEPGLTVPHPAMHQRRFVLEPLSEIAGDAVHPILHRTVRELLDTLPAGQAVRKIVTNQ